MAKIEIYVCCHQQSQVPASPVLVPVQVGAALAASRFEGFMQDDTGENISHKNPCYCELTALYWAWKNRNADYCGLFHYRRYLYPNRAEKRPYIYSAGPSAQVFAQLGGTEWEQLIPQYELILPTPEDMHVTVRQHYACAPYHHAKDLALTEQILQELYPQYADAAERYLSGTKMYFGNICIMRRQRFEHYCSWLFSILEEFDRRADLTGYGRQELRVDGYLAERLLGIYCTHHSEVERLELPRIHFENDTATRLKLQCKNLLLPPGSRLRAWVKRLHTSS